MVQQDDGKKFLYDVKQYVNLKIESIELAFVEKLSLLVGKIILLGVIGLFSAALMIFLMMLIHNILLSIIGIPWAVILIEIGFIVFLMIMMWIMRERIIIRPIANMIIKVIYEIKNDDDALNSQEQNRYE